MLISKVLLELLMWQYPMSPSDIGIVALDVVPSFIILDASHGSLKGWQSKNAQVALAWAIWYWCLVLCHDALAQKQERQGDVCSYLFRHGYCFYFAFGVVIVLSLGILLIEDLCYHGLHVLTDLHKVFVEDALTLITALEGVELGQWHILAFFFLDVCHVEVGLAIELTSLELVAFLYVHTAIHACLGCHKVSCGLSADPSCRHIRDFTGWHKTIHILIQVDARFVSIEGHAFLQLHHLSKDVGG